MAEVFSCGNPVLSFADTHYFGRIRQFDIGDIIDVAADSGVVAAYAALELKISFAF